MNTAVLSSAIADRRSFWQRQRWLILRRTSQILILLAFLSGPAFGVWVLKGNLSSSLLFDTIPLSDPLLVLQTLVAGQPLYHTAAYGALLVAAFYLLVGGRVFCAWVCPVNAVTDAAGWLRRRLGLKGSRAPDPRTRYALLAALLLATAITGSLVWEWVNPVTLAHRAIVFGLGGAVWLLAGIFLYDLLIAGRGWCGHLCPVGAFYSLLGRGALLRVSATRRSACNDCMDCYAVCPEPQVIRPALKGAAGSSPLILSPNCTTCGRCIDVCAPQIFSMTHRFDPRSE